MLKGLFSYLLVITSIALVAAAGFAKTKTSSLLSEVENRYRDSKSVKMDVDKTVKMNLMDRTKTSSGTILIKSGKIRWETEKPEHTLVLADGKAIWMVDYPVEEGDPIRVIKAMDPKKSQPHAVVAFLLGKGKIGNDFAVISEKPDGDLMKLDLKPRQEQTEVQWLTLFVNKDDKTIMKLSFEDNVGNTTTLDFSNIKFGEAIASKEFKFSPPKGAEVQVVN
jgi:outer membrane lipoprotein carrier protein